MAGFLTLFNTCCRRMKTRSKENEHPAKKNTASSRSSTHLMPHRLSTIQSHLPCCCPCQSRTCTTDCGQRVPYVRYATPGSLIYVLLLFCAPDPIFCAITTSIATAAPQAGSRRPCPLRWHARGAQHYRRMGTCTQYSPRRPLHLCLGLAAKPS
eukprot:1160097-Pelagomonas_calceolata.AAC.1